MQPYRLSFDLGTNSIGWGLLNLDRQGKPREIRALGSRIFSDGRDPQDKASLAVARRLARQMRRRRDRYLTRRTRLMGALVRFGLMPADPAARKRLEVAVDPYLARERATRERLEPFEIGRALFHLNQRRGYKPVRTATKPDEEAGKVKEAVERLEAAIAAAGAPTLGAWFAWRKTRGETLRARLAGKGKEAAYPFYPARRMLEAEFDTLWAEQARHHPDLLTAEAREILRHRIFHQRPLKPPPVGRCTLYPDDGRAPRALPSAQRLRLFQELASLRVIHLDLSERPLTPAERDRIVAFVQGRPPKAGRKPGKVQKSVPFEKLRGLLELPPGTGFSLESDKRPELLGDETGARIAPAFGPGWTALPLEEQDALVELLLTEAEPERAIAALTARWALDEATAAKLAGATLPDFHGRYGRRAVAELLPVLERETRGDPDGRVRPIRLDEAVKLLRGGKDHSDFSREGALLDALPYYGAVLERHVAFGTGNPADPEEKRVGRVANPTVHIALNQLRHLVNAILARHGRPEEIVIELARDLKRSAEDRRREDKRQADNQKRNEERKRLILSLGERPTPRNLLKLRLWEEQGPVENRRCPYSGETISMRMLLSEQVDIDHILPFSVSLDDSAANKVVCLREANRIKRNRSPWEAFGHDSERWAGILARAEALPKNKRWRFAPDALEKLEGEGGLRARHLNDTRHLSRLAVEYLRCVCPKVRVSPGRLTALLRRRWGIDAILAEADGPPPEVPAETLDPSPAEKNRADHRHHALDAVVIGCIDRSMVQRVQLAAASAEREAAAREDNIRRVLEGFKEEPWDGFRAELERRARTIVVSHRPEHGIGGALHKETAYGPVDPPEEGFNLVVRKPIDGLSKDEINSVRDPRLRRALIDRLAIRRRDANDPATALAKAAEDLAAQPASRGIRRVRVLKKESNPIRVEHGGNPSGPRSGGPFHKLLLAGEVHHVDVALRADGRRWVGHWVTLFEAHGGRGADGAAAPPRLGDGERFLMRLHKGDCLKLEHKGRVRVMQVVKLEPSSNSVVVVEPHQVKTDRSKHVKISCDQLRARGARRVTVDPLGRVRVHAPGARVGIGGDAGRTAMEPAEDIS
ncbi:type II CRISPR RNA-guided endonuclease Cas9 [Azospirillum sp. B510]|uniref:type II CRISPR RNA-guided endonuclease Cas9 n=2 Tax=Alphaproteobacteria TaxID=28211 RepID=UPI000317B278|nr:type II CRISPR RNA-guided endonuclease Cas9 [Azospirillum sp. B510]